ncbi:TBC1 domain family member 10B [Zancudomyces culisetae]|uniref:TBC1 domain family member 10B n=1 Tax=Zancudomyces culisetae TaxID=1213189 RepID=A0A1R1PLV7_ZANCU|nr:TBC1 domain family member 10B [Zancudomyces culisetae]|eukprot:OMH81958.1 TBC1 domain family member 10B [Zancudomyces culisetae]
MLSDLMVEAQQLKTGDEELDSVEYNNSVEKSTDSTLHPEIIRYKGGGILMESRNSVVDRSYVEAAEDSLYYLVETEKRKYTPEWGNMEEDFEDVEGAGATKAGEQVKEKKGKEAEGKVEGEKKRDKKKGYSVVELAHLARHKEEITGEDTIFGSDFEKALNNAVMIGDYLENWKKTQQWNKEEKLEENKKNTIYRASGLLRPKKMQDLGGTKRLNTESMLFDRDMKKSQAGRQAMKVKNSRVTFREDFREQVHDESSQDEESQDNTDVAAEKKEKTSGFNYKPSQKHPQGGAGKSQGILSIGEPLGRVSWELESIDFNGYEDGLGIAKTQNLASVLLQKAGFSTMALKIARLKLKRSERRRVGKGLRKGSTESFQKVSYDEQDGCVANGEYHSGSHDVQRYDDNTYSSLKHRYRSRDRNEKLNALLRKGEKAAAEGAQQTGDKVGELRALRLRYVERLDEYGFLVFGGTNETSERPQVEENEEDEQRKIEQWSVILKTFSINDVRNSRKFQQLAQAGFPREMRPVIYWYLLDVKHRFKDLLDGMTLSSEYESLKSKPVEPTLKDVIGRDIPRTYPDHALFYDESCEGQLLLRSILDAYANYNSEVGYCQGMNRLAGLFAIVGMSESESFWSLATLLDTHMLNYFTPSLSQLKVHAYVFEMLLTSHNRKLAAHLSASECEPLMYVTPWFMTVFTMSLPWSSVLRVWDWFLFRGIKVLFRVALAIMDICSDHLLTNCPTLPDQLALLLHIPQNWLVPDKLIAAASNIKITSRQIRYLCKAATKKIS